jgi:hypothetical protein
MKTTPCLAVLLAAFTISALCGDAPLAPFPLDWSNTAESVIDLSAFLDSPAGKRGHLRVKGEHIVTPDGRRFRFWGVNLCGPDGFPDRTNAVLIARDLARLGVNVVRFHHMDSNWGRSAIDMKRDDTRHLDPENLDRIHFFIAELKRHGIYANLNLNVLRRFKAGDGVRDWQLLGYGKSATYFNARLVELQHEYARQLLTHRNSYTGREYRHEPAVAVVEMLNENCVLEGWTGWRLVGRHDEAGDTWSPIPVCYAEELTDQFNAWLPMNAPAVALSAIRKEAEAGPDGQVRRLKPDEYACEGFPILTAYALFHDWDGIYWFTWGRGRLGKTDDGIPRNGWFDFSVDPMKLATLHACALMWHRRDFATARKTVVRAYTEDQLIEALRMDRAKERPFFTPGFARSTPLEHATRFRWDGQPASAFPPAAALNRIASDTGQLNWWDTDRKRGVVTLETDRTQALIGFVRASGRSVRHLAADVRNDHCALVLTSLDGRPIRRAQRLLLLATSRATNTGFRWEDDRQTVAEWGHGPVQIEPVTGSVILRELGKVKGLRARPLSPVGRPLGRDLPAQLRSSGWQLGLGEPVTTWVLIELTR